MSIQGSTAHRNDEMIREQNSFPAERRGRGFPWWAVEMTWAAEHREIFLEPGGESIQPSIDA